MLEIGLATLAVAVVSGLVGLGIQWVGHLLCQKFPTEDAADVANFASVRITAIFSIAIGLIFGSAYNYRLEMMRDAQEEVRLLGTALALSRESQNQHLVTATRSAVERYVRSSIAEIEGKGPTDERLEALSALVALCSVEQASGIDAAARWRQAELNRICSRLLDLRGKKRVASMGVYTATPLWIFIVLTFACLALLFGGFEWKPLNLAYASMFYVTVGVTAFLIFVMSNPHVLGGPPTRTLHALLEYARS